MSPIVGKSYGLNLLSMHTLQAPTVIILCVLNAKFVCSNGLSRFISVYSQHAQSLICQRFISVYCQFVFLSGVCATTAVVRKNRLVFLLRFCLTLLNSIFCQSPLSSRFVSKSLLNNSPPNSRTQTQTCPS